MINPTGGDIRVDQAGDGHFGASRRKWRETVGAWEHYEHYGVDLLLPDGPGQIVVAPTTGNIYRWMQAYADTEHYKGLVIRNSGWEVRLLYVTPSVMEWGPVAEGSIVGIAQDISKRYPGSGMQPHVHMEVRERCESGYSILVDPWKMIGVS